jgi:16S rRNA (cytidine1402-2'-O)-methyltransferase
MNESVVVAGTLYVVATPIGNVGDLTQRARDVLTSVQVLAAEDTRMTQDLLRHASIATNAKLISVREHNEAQAAQGIVGWLAAGQSVAYVSDAGTPGVSDPGARLVRAVQDAGFAVVPVPGVSAVTALLCACGLLGSSFTFYGFLPTQASALEAMFDAFDASAHVCVFFESTHRIAHSCERLAARFPAREIVIGKELTKRFEMIARVPTAQLPAWLAQDAQRAKGEFVLALAPAHAAEHVPNEAEAKKWLAELSKELAPARAAKIVAKMTGVPRDVLYKTASSE